MLNGSGYVQVHFFITLTFLTFTLMGLKKDIDKLFTHIMDLEGRQKAGETATVEEVSNLKSLTLTMESIAESMIPEKKRKTKK
jgi:hypothetical protein